MRIPRAATLRTRLTIYYVSVLAVLLLVYAALVFAFQYASFTRQMLHDEVQDVVTVEGLLYFDTQGVLQLRQDYYSRPESHLLIDRLMEVRDSASGRILYKSPTLGGRSLGGALRPGEGDRGFDERHIQLEDGMHVLAVSHVHGLDGRKLVIRLAYSLAPFRDQMWDFLFLLLMAIPVALLLAATAGQVVARRALMPVAQMTERAESITAHNLHDRLEVAHPQDELGHMATVFNGLLQRLEEAFAQLQRFTADAAHELRTPLAALRATGEVALQKEQTAEEYRSVISNVLEEAVRLSGTIDSLLLLARAESTQPGDRQSVFPLRVLVREVLSLLEVLGEERGIRIIEQVRTADGMEIHADRHLLRVAILNVVHNALKFSPENGTLQIVYAVSSEEPRMISLSVQDEGPGISAGSEERVFDRFVTAVPAVDRTPAGTGLGLAITKLILERAGGRVRFDADSPAGASCILYLPAVPNEKRST